MYMFTFFRRYQRFIYLVVTAVIILSFSFFGTYSAFTSGKGDDPVVFTTVSNKRITRSEFNDYVHFFSTDALSGEGLSGNPLNDGVIENDIISTPVGEALTKRFAPMFLKEWELRFKREKQFQPYRHPQAPFISAEQVWSYFAPDLKSSLEMYQTQDKESALDYYSAKRALYMAEKQFPAVYLRQILLYQQKQFDWVEPDVALEGRPLGLFGYQQLSDWFGQAFIDKSAEFIIEMAAQARNEGLSVSRAEVLASLYKNAQIAAKRYGEKSQQTPDEIMKRTLLSLGMDESRAVKVWGDVLLMRRALLDVPNKVVLNPKAFAEKMQSQALTVELEGYQLQPSLRLGSSRDLFKMETWLDAVTKKEKVFSLIPSSNFRSPDEVGASFPELVERRFLLSITEVDTTKLANHIRIKDIWAWQNDHWDELVKEIPAIKGGSEDSRESRFRALENLTPALRTRADEIARKALIAAHGEWISVDLDSAKPETKVVGIRLQGGDLPFQGIKDRSALVKELASAPIAEPTPTLNQYTQDGVHFYKIIVLDRKTDSQLVSLPDLLADGTLDSVLDRILEASYERVRNTKPSDFKKENGSWKPFSEVKDAVAELHYAPLLRRLSQAATEWKDVFPSYCQWDDPKVARVAVRFLPLLASRWKEIKEKGEDENNVGTPCLPSEKDSLSLDSSPCALFALVKFSEKLSQGDVQEKPMFKEAFTVESGAWISPHYSQNLGPFVAHVKTRFPGEYKDAMRRMIYDLQGRLGEEIVEIKANEYVQKFFPLSKEN